MELMRLARFLRAWARLLLRNRRFLVLLFLLLVGFAVSLALGDPTVSPLGDGDGKEPGIPGNDPYGG